VTAPTTATIAASGRTCPRWNVVACEPGHGLARPLDRRAVRVVRKHEPRERARRDRGRILVGALDRGLDLGELPLDLGLEERRREDHFGQEVEAERQVLLEHPEGGGEAVAARPRFEAPAHELDRRVELGSRALRRPPREQRPREIGEPGAVGRVVHAARADEHAHGDDRHRRPLGHEEHDAVRQDLAVRQRRRGGRRRGERKHEQRDRPNHGGPARCQDPSASRVVVHEESGLV
jgi:hypothetical protein